MQFPAPHTAEWCERMARIEWNMGHEHAAADLFRKAGEMRLAQQKAPAERPPGPDAQPRVG